MKFKIGDRVRFQVGDRVARTLKKGTGLHGIIIAIDQKEMFPYSIQWDTFDSTALYQEDEIGLIAEGNDVLKEML